MSELRAFTPEQYRVELERQVEALNQHVSDMARNGQINIDILADSFAMVLSHYVGQVHPPERMINLLARFDEMLDDGIAEYLVPEGAVIQ